MGFKDLKKIGKKENRIFLILIIWLLIAFTFVSFDIPGINEILDLIGFILFIPLIIVCMVLVLIAVFTDKEVKEITLKQYIIYFIIGILIMIIFTTFSLILGLILMILAILSYVMITAIFTLYGCYKKGIEWDEKIYNWPRPINFFARWIQFFGGIIIAIILLLIAAGAGTIWGLVSKDIANFYILIPWLIILVIIVLAIFGYLFVFLAKLNAWLGVFFIWVALYTYYLMFNAFYSLSKSDGTGTSSLGGDFALYIQIGLYIFDLILILSTIGTLVGERTEVIGKTLHMKSDTILIWLIFSKAAYEFVELIPGLKVGTFKAVGVFILFLPLILITGIYGIFHYFKVKKERKKKKKEKKAEKKVRKKSKKCPHCEALNQKNAKFCKGCGEDLKKK